MFGEKVKMSEKAQKVFAYPGLLVKYVWVEYKTPKFEVLSQMVTKRNAVFIYG